MIYIAVCDDNEKLAKALRNKICQYVKENYEPVDITVYTQSTLLQYDIEDGKYFDLVLSDIEMPNIDGMNLVAYIKKHLPEVLMTRPAVGLSSMARILSKVDFPDPDSPMIAT